MRRINLFPFAPRPLVFGHRGCPVSAPENTLASFSKIVEYGVPGVEFDIHECASGEFVVIHDHSLERLTGRPGIVEEFSLSDLRQRDVGGWYGEEFRGQHIPRLEEVFELLGENVYYDIEVKCERTKGGDIAGKLLPIIKRYRLQDRVFISSFNPYVLAPVHKIDKTIQTAIIYCDSKELPLLLRKGLGRFVSGSRILKPDRKLVSNTSMLIESTLLGHTVISWTVNEIEEAQRLLNAGVEGLISDDPVKILNFVSAESSTKPL